EDARSGLRDDRRRRGLARPRAHPRDGRPRIRVLRSRLHEILREGSAPVPREGGRLGGRAEALTISDVPIYLEVGIKRSFATAVEWPGWSRSGRDEDEAVATLASYGSRYAAVVAPAYLKLKPPADASGFRIIKRVKGNATTEFGAPAVGLPSDAAPLAEAELERLERILGACWSALDRAAKNA